MLKTRVIPCLLLKDGGLVKTIRFKNPNYVGDPINAVKIYNEREVDELIFLDINASVDKKKPDLKLINDIATECFMPVCYGGGIKNINDMKKIFKQGIEKIAINTSAFEDPLLLKRASELFGNQSIVVSVDVKKNLWGKYQVYIYGGRKNTGISPTEYCLKMEKLGAGEILLTSIDKDGTWEGFDTDLILKITSSVNIPVIVCGGAGKAGDFTKAVKAGASAVATGSMVVYQGKDLGVLINFPAQKELEKVLD